MAESLEDILKRKSAPAGGQTLEDIMAAKQPRTVTYPFENQPPADVGPQFMGKQFEEARKTARPGSFVVGDAITEFLADVAVTGKFGSIGESMGRRLLQRFPRVGAFLGRTAGFTGGGVTAQAVSGEDINVPAAATGAAFGVGAEKILQGVGSALARGGKVPRTVVRQTMEQPTAGRVGEMFGGAEPEQFLAEAQRVGAGVKQALKTKSAGRVEAERMIKMADQLVPHGVDAEPIRQRILSLRNQQAQLGPAKQLNAHLEELASSLPERLSYSELDSLVRELGEPIKTQMGNIEMKLPQATRKRILDFARQYRNKEIPGAVGSFKSAEKYIGATKDLYKRVFDAKGNMRPGAPQIWRKAIQDPQVMAALRTFDQTTNGQFNVTDTGLRLARKAYWTPDDGETAEGLLLAGIGWFGRASLFLSRGAGKAAAAASRPVGAASSVAARRAFESAFDPMANP